MGGHLLAWDAWNRSDACKSVTNAGAFAGVSLHEILYRAMRKLFIDEQGNLGMVYNHQLIRAARLIRAMDGWNRWGYEESDMKRLLQDGLYSFGDVFESGKLTIDVDNSPASFGNANLCSFLGNSNTININFGLLMSIALGTYQPGMVAFPRNDDGVALFVDLMAGEIMHELMHTQGFHHKPDKGAADESFGSVYFLSLPHLAKLSALGAGGNWWWFSKASYLFGGNFYDQLAGLNYFNTQDTPRWSGYQSMGGFETEPGAVVVSTDASTSFPELIDVYARHVANPQPASSAPPIRPRTYMAQRWFDSSFLSPSTLVPKQGWAFHNATSDIELDSGCTVVSWNSGHRSIFASRKGQVVHKYWVNGDWSQWINCGGPGVLGEVAAVGIAGNSIELYIRSGDSHLWQGDFRGLDQQFHWHKLDDAIIDTPPSAIAVTGNTRHIFSQNATEICYKAWTSTQGWLPWVGIGGKCKGRVCAIALADQWSIEVYARGLDDALWQCNWNGDFWSGWNPHNDGTVMTSSPSVVTSRMDLRTLFFANADAEVVWKSFEPSF